MLNLTEEKGVEDYTVLSIDTQLTDLMACLQESIAVLEKENALLESSRTAEISPLIPSKERLTNALSEHLEWLHTQTNILQQMSPEQKDKLAQKLTRFQELVVSNGKFLTRAKENSEGLIGALVQETQKGQVAQIYSPTEISKATHSPQRAATISFNTVI